MFVYFKHKIDKKSALYNKARRYLDFMALEYITQEVMSSLTF